MSMTVTLRYDEALRIEVTDAAREHRNLDLGRTGVGAAAAVLGDDLCFDVTG